MICLIRFIEFLNCCCGGGGGGDDVDGCHVTVKEEGGRHGLCRDFNFEHPIRTDACRKLAQYPFSLPLYSGYVCISVCISPSVLVSVCVYFTLALHQFCAQIY